MKFGGEGFRKITTGAAILAGGMLISDATFAQEKAGHVEKPKTEQEQKNSSNAIEKKQVEESLRALFTQIMNEGKLKLDRAFEGTNYTGDIGKYGVRLCKQNEDDKNTYITPGSRDWAKINYTDGKNIHYRVMQNYSGVSGFEFSEQEQPGLKKMGINDFNSEYNTVLLRDLVKDSVYARHLTDTEINHIINDVIRSSKIANEVPGVKQEDHTSNIKEVSGSDLGKILYGYTPATGGLPFSMIAEQFKDFKFAVTEAVGNTESAADMQAQQKLISSGMGKHRIFTFTKNEGGNTHVVKVEIHK